MNSMVSLFSGLGGLDLGLETAGFDCLYASDIDEKAVASLKANSGYKIDNSRRFLQNAIVEQRDIRELSGADLLKKLSKSRGEIDLLAGGPPCQSWSSAGRQRGFDDPRGRLLDDYLRVAAQLDCRFLLFENVRGLVTARGDDGIPGSALAWLRNELLKRGWQTSAELFNAADFGVPQRRVRLILLGYRTGDAPSYPMPSHSRLENWPSMRTVLEGVSPLSPSEVILPNAKLAEQLSEIPDGSGVKSPGKRETTRPGGHWGYKQGAFIANMDLPARTVTANPQQDWIRDSSLGLRRLAPRECAALQTFPANWIIDGNQADQYRLIGNAVPPRLAQAVAYPILEALSNKNVVNFSRQSLKPLPKQLQNSILYTLKEERRNGESRKMASALRHVNGI